MSLPSPYSKFRRYALTIALEALAKEQGVTLSRAPTPELVFEETFEGSFEDFETFILTEGLLAVARLWGFMDEIKTYLIKDDIFARVDVKVLYIAVVKGIALKKKAEALLTTVGRRDHSE